MKKVLNLLEIFSISFGLIIGNTFPVLGLDEINNNFETVDAEETIQNDDKSVISSTNEETNNEENNNKESDNEFSDNNSESEIIGQTSFVDENGDITTKDVYDGTTGEEFNPNAKVVTTANMVNFNCNKAGVTTSYIDANTGQAGYLSKASAADAAYLGMENGKVKFMISGVVGLVDPNLVEIVPQGTYYASNYEVNSSGKLYHYISNDVNATGNQGNKNYVGEGPSYLKKNTEYYSYDGHYFYVDYNTMIKDYQNNVRTNSVNPNDPYYNYFQYLPLRSKTNYTGSQITTYLNNKANSPTSKLNNTGDIFIKYQNTYGVNALLAASFAALESGWGKSSIAQSKNNLFGLNATDNNPAGNADTYPTVENCIYDFTANWMSLRYLNPKNTSVFRGGYFGNKGSGIFGKYSSDPYEGEKCASIAENMDAAISGADKNYYNIGIKDVTGISYTTLNVRAGSSTSTTSYYTTIKNPAYAFLITSKTSENGFYQIQNELPNSDGTYDFESIAYVSGNYVNIVNKGNDISKIQIIDSEVSDISTSGYKVSCTIKTSVGIDRIEFPTWTEKNGQDDITWGKGTVVSQGDGTYKVSYQVKKSDHGNQTGVYNTHIYAYDKNGKLTFKVLDQITVPEEKGPEISDVVVSEATTSGYSVSCTIKTSVGINRIEFPTWTEKNGQDDITWGKGTVVSQGDGTYKVSYQVKKSDHGNQTGVYNTHIYAYDKNGKLTFKVLDQITVPENQSPQISQIEVTDVTADSYTLKVTASDDGEIVKADFPTWSEYNGQDDLEWNPILIDNNTFEITIYRKDHNYEFGKYITHVYVYDDEGEYTAKAVEVILEEPSLEDVKLILKDVYVTNVTEDGFEIQATVSTNGKINRVEYATWTEKNGQDDIIWTEVKGDNNVYSLYINRSDHNYEFGMYNVHIYIYIDGIGYGYVGKIINLTNTSNHQGWIYKNGQKYFYDNKGNVAGNMPSKKVIDVSEYNGTIDWDTVYRYGDIDGAILRITRHANGYYEEDKQFATNLMNCRRYGIPFGVYIYDYANNATDAYNEAEIVVQILKKYNISTKEMAYPVFYDVERDNLSLQQNIQNVEAFVSRVNNYGYNAKVYSYRNMLNTKLNDPRILKYTSWMAAYTDTIGWSNPYYSGLFGWQYTSGGTIPGISGYVDISCWYVV